MHRLPFSRQLWSSHFGRSSSFKLSEWPSGQVWMESRRTSVARATFSASSISLDSAELNAQVKESDGLITGFPWSCDGRCRRPVEDWQEIHFCEICSNFTCFCDECIKLVKTGTLSFRKCDESHTFYQGYPLSKELQDIATVRTEGKVLPRTEWLEALRKEWMA